MSNAPISMPLRRETEETWKQVIDLFRKHGLSEPPIRLRDELVVAFEWAWHGVALQSAADTSPSPYAHMAGLPIELHGVSDALENGKGMWRTCTGCHESNEGHPTGPYSSLMRCHLGGGCFECGGIGAVWDTTDYEDMGNALAAQAIAEETQPDHRHAFVPNKKYPWFCAHCGYAPHEPLKHIQPAATATEGRE